MSLTKLYFYNTDFNKFYHNSKNKKYLSPLNNRPYGYYYKCIKIKLLKILK